MGGGAAPSVTRLKHFAQQNASTSRIASSNSRSEISYNQRNYFCRVTEDFVTWGFEYYASVTGRRKKLPVCFALQAPTGVL